MRNYASIGSYDFIAFRKAQGCTCNCIGCNCNIKHHTEMLMIQVKGDPKPSSFPEEAKQALLKDAENAGARPVLVYRETRKKVLGLTKKGKARKQGVWMTVYL